MDSLRLEYLGQSIEYRHLMLVPVDMVESVYVDLESVILSRRSPFGTEIQGINQPMT